MNKIRLPHDGAEYAHFFFDPLPLPPGATLEASIAGGAWTALDMTGPVPRLLLRGPDSSQTLGVLVADSGDIRVRVTSSPEVIVRGAGYVQVVR